MAQCIVAKCQQSIHVWKKGITWQVKHLKINQIYYDYKPCTSYGVKLEDKPSIITNKCVNSVEKKCKYCVHRFVNCFAIKNFIYGGCLVLQRELAIGLCIK